MLPAPRGVRAQRIDTCNIQSYMAKKKAHDAQAKSHLVQLTDRSRIALGVVDPESGEPTPAMSLARMLASLFQEAKQSGSVAAAVALFHSTVDATARQSEVPIACGKGCSHCCHIWV